MDYFSLYDKITNVANFLIGYFMIHYSLQDNPYDYDGSFIPRYQNSNETKELLRQMNELNEFITKQNKTEEQKQNNH